MIAWGVYLHNLCKLGTITLIKMDLKYRVRASLTRIPIEPGPLWFERAFSQVAVSWQYPQAVDRRRGKRRRRRWRRRRREEEEEEEQGLYDIAWVCTKLMRTSEAHRIFVSLCPGYLVSSHGCKITMQIWITKVLRIIRALGIRSYTYWGNLSVWTGFQHFQEYWLNL